MLAGLELPPAVEAERAVTAGLASLRSGAHRGVVGDSPPGAGKSALVVRAAVDLAAADEPLIITAQINKQVDELIERLAQKALELSIGIPSGTGAALGLTSRHRHACVVVALAGITELLDGRPSVEPVHLNPPVTFPDGWEAHCQLLGMLAAGWQSYIPRYGNLGELNGHHQH
ncbi:hypothetical protein ACSNN7_15710 [Micromonospora sp. URMC 105]|uniref:hypothetical protein n=1 Tax=Micromonospora sp. URMC 105 TaxID=3423413 RepID=UPI003F1E0410